MASYRLHAGIVKRSEGRSVVAAAAYRAGARLEDERLGTTHDYRRRAGVLHAEILAPENTPAWMLDRTQLWNAVERIEKRKDAQLSRDIELSLPHELDAEQRLELVREFVREQFVASGMIADIAIHAPSRDGDQRNHHAHVLLTMREVMGDGFASTKNRSWNDTERLAEWRAAWEAAQNLALERAGSNERVSSESFAARGIDREPEFHLGPHASAMARKGKESRIAEENEGRRGRNAARADAHRDLLATRLEREAARFEEWAARKRAELDAAQALRRLDIVRAQELERESLAEDLARYYDPHLATIRAEAEAVRQRLERRGLRGLWRSFTGAKARDLERLRQIEKTAQETEERKAFELHKLERQHAAAREAVQRSQGERQEHQAEAIQRAREKKAEALSSEFTRSHTYAARRGLAQAPEQDNTASHDRDAPAQPGKGRDHGFEQ
jgi:ATP-dependent exoDNAse (exonuclease V) alpha subunit